jgi:cellulose synthase/poly-beta-1,6-N-acetylglucosamine synthase-like glycosyltransferase
MPPITDKNLELPLGKRKKFYRFLEILPGVLSYSAVVLLFVLSAINPLYGAMYMLLILITMVTKAVAIAFRTVQGHSTMQKALRIDWHRRLGDLENVRASYMRSQDESSTGWRYKEHVENLRVLGLAEDGYFPRPSQLYHAVIIATYNETMDTLGPTVEAVRDTAYDNDHMIIVIAYEERGGEAIEKTVNELKKKYGKEFRNFILIKHPANLPDEVVGKGPNVTYAGEKLAEMVPEWGLRYSDVVITTLDSDNRPSKYYFDYVMYEYIVHEDRKRLSYQPISLFNNNIWDVPAPIRVISVGNSFWNVISSMRPHLLRNFASHSQPMDALVEMNFWSKRTIVEDGHQFWRSLFHFKGDYRVVPIHVPIGQDAVLSETFWKTLKAQFVQLRRWDYGASDIAYVGTRLFSKRDKRGMGFWKLAPNFFRLLDGHVTLAYVPLVSALGGWVPMVMTWIFNPYGRDMLPYNFPVIVSYIQTFAMVGLFITILLSLRMLPKRPKKYGVWRHMMMVGQWILMPVTAIAYQAAAAYYSQTRLMFGRYMEKFDVTKKVVKK